VFAEKRFLPAALGVEEHGYTPPVALPPWSESGRAEAGQAVWFPSVAVNSWNEGPVWELPVLYFHNPIAVRSLVKMIRILLLTCMCD